VKVKKTSHGGLGDRRWGWLVSTRWTCICIGLNPSSVDSLFSERP
jgi:hypothetical protein